MKTYQKYEKKRSRIQLLQRFLGEKLAGLPYAHSRIRSNEYGNKYIRQMLESGVPFSASRFGGTELLTVIYRETGCATEEEREYADSRLGMDSGFFPCTKEAIDKYRDVLIETSKSIDMLGIWFFVNNEEYIIDKYLNRPVCALPKCLEPYYFSRPWSAALKGKKVLVIHPFTETIRKQYEKRKLLFANPDVLPEFELVTLKAVQTLGNQKDDRFDTWFDALEYMKQEIDKVDFDIALLGCGAYGIPLQDYIKNKGKQSVYLGGALQILFGIKGKRWDSHPIISKLYNDSWVRPLETEKIDAYKKVELGGPYW